MAPSRGCTLLRALHQAPRGFPYRVKPLPTSSRRHHHDHASATDFASSVAKPTASYQIYVSRSLDPYLNLSIEHYLLQKTPAHSTILFLYTNRPCVVLGRNQNPWMEVDLPALKDPLRHPQAGSSPSFGEVLLVRRRSGGGTVFHDEGNVNYSVICPTAAFDRDKHARMVVRALRGLGVDRARVNARHDIVLQPVFSRSTGSDVTSEAVSSTPLKISGSAYKLTRLRALHHGTCLLSSPNLDRLSYFLRSPAKSYIKARGVESVSSPVANVGVSNADFVKAVAREFATMYAVRADDFLGSLQSPRSHEEDGPVGFVVGEAQASIPEIQRGINELEVQQTSALVRARETNQALTFTVGRLEIRTDSSIYLLQPARE